MVVFFFFKQKTAYEILTCDWSSDVCSSDLVPKVLCLGTEGSNGSLFRNGWFQCFFCLGTEGSNGSLYRNGWFQCFFV